MRLRLLLLLFSSCICVLGQTVRWQPASGSLAHNQISQLTLVFEDCAPVKNIPLPSVDGLAMQAGGFSNSFSSSGGRTSQTHALIVAVRPSKKQPVTIPAFTVETDKGTLTVPAASYDVVAATLGSSGISLESVVTSRLVVPREVWAGEVFPLVYDLTILRRYAHSLGSEVDWAPAPLSIEEWSKPEQREAVINGENHIVLSQATRAILRAPGTVTLNAANQLVNVIKGVDTWGRPNLDQFAISSDRPSITIKPLPPSPPNGFSGAVGKFTIQSKVVPTTGSVGEPITWTVTLNGTGNWPDIPGLPAREVSKDFRFIQPQAKRTTKDSALFEATLSEDVVLIPTKPGTYNLGPLAFTYFDPSKGAYQTITTPRTAIVITPDTSAPLPPAVKASTDTPPPAKPRPPEPPTALPREPLPAASPAFLPLSHTLVKALLLALLLPVLAGWFWFAWRRARQTDPLLPRRTAHTRLHQTLAGLRECRDVATRSQLLRAWQHDTAQLWPVARAVPSVRDFNPTDPASLEAAAATVWIALWTEAERCIYRADTPLPPDWLDRAEAALAGRTPPALRKRSLFLPRNLLPFAATLALLGLFSGFGDLHAQTGAEVAYHRGDFALAEKSWREEISKNTTDWAAHHNLSLALAQQNRWQESAAHALTAFVQNPGDEAVRWQVSLALDHAGYAPTTLSAFLTPSPAHSLARQFSPAVWQRWLLIGGVLLAAALLLGLRLIYGTRPLSLKIITGATAVTGLLILAFSLVSLRLYAPTVDTRVALIWRPGSLRSIPTEADTTQKTTPIAAGSLALVEHTFMGWSRIAFANGQTGWIRDEELRLFWR